ncbi:cysteine hydrolase [Endozoicomonas sp. G2_2]|uniref:cysteine hydrolase family protein n=1 Tax=Endozoicomonas sp. G2_2 TaxID=2821092 RepID=UPI001ADD0B8A|nr:cysteine hydrolase family protein [Endozoicomonas sp. G2_2]MBO9471636.1 cysteine hydrolase [Endozoicomonas sp. G2_2]
MDHTALILIDVQNAFDDAIWGTRNNSSTEQNMANLLQLWRSRNLPIIHIRHRSANPDSPLNPDSPGYAFKTETAPSNDEVVFTKSVHNAFLGTGLEAYLRDNDLLKLVITGFTTDHCVSTTTRMASDLGFTVRLVADSTATFDRKDIRGESITAEQIHRINLASLNGEFCKVVSTDEVMSSFAYS